MFSIGVENFLPFSSNLKLLSANSFNLEESEICPVGMGYRVGTIVVYKNVLLLAKCCFFFSRVIEMEIV